MSSKGANVQQQIRENAQELQDYLKELYEWEEEIKKKDKKLNEQAKTKPKDLPPIRESFVTTFGATTNVSPKIVPADKQVEETNEQKAIKAKEKGNELFNKGEYRKAILEYTHSIEMDAKNASIPLANRAMAYLKLNDARFQKAEDDCTSSIDIDNKYIKAYARRGSARIGLKKYTQAKEDFDFVLKLEPNNKAAADELAKLAKLTETLDTKTQQSQPILTKPSSPQSNTTPTSDTLLPSKPSSPPSTPIVISPVTSEPVQDTSETLHIPKVTPTTSTTPSKTSTTSTTSTTPSRRVFNIKVEVPKEPPKTSYEFEAFWNSAKTDHDLLYQYLKLIQPSQYPTLFQNALNEDILTGILGVLHSKFIEHKDWNGIFETMKYLSQVNRFAMNIMFLDPDQREEVENLMKNLRDSNLFESKDIDQLSKMYLN